LRLITCDGLYDAAGKELRCHDIAESLVSAGLWERLGNDYLVHDYLVFQLSKEQILAERAKAKVRMQQHRSSGEVRANTARSSHAPTPTPTPSILETPATQAKRREHSQPEPKVPQPEAVRVYRDVMFRSLHQSQWAKVAGIVGDSAGALALWRQILESWRDHGWNKDNLARLLQLFAEGRVPDDEGPRKRSSRASPPVAFDQGVADLPDGFNIGR